MPKLTLTTTQLRYLQRLVADDLQVIEEACRRMDSGETLGALLPPKAELVLHEQLEMASALASKIDLAW